MGVASYNRGSEVLSKLVRADHTARPVAFEIMDRINALPKIKCLDLGRIGTPLGDVVIEQEEGRNVWWVMNPEDLHEGYCFWYYSLSEAVTSWNISLVSYDETTQRWTATPNKGN